MRFKMVLAAAMGLALALGASADAPKTELDKFTGTWLAVSITHDGKETPAEDVKNVVLNVKGKDYTLFTGKELIKGTHKLDGGKTPKTIDATRTRGPDKGMTIKGIYELDEKTFKVCFAAPGKERPKGFNAKAGTGNRLIVMKRIKSKTR
jgi:uncharacterized protein (TIGR03067 family)